MSITSIFFSGISIKLLAVALVVWLVLIVLTLRYNKQFSGWLYGGRGPFQCMSIALGLLSITVGVWVAFFLLSWQTAAVMAVICFVGEVCIQVYISYKNSVRKDVGVLMG